MKILMLAPKYMGLDEPIRKELTAQGHHVVCIEDRMLDFDYHHPWRGWHDRAIRAIRCRMNRSFERYWKERIEADERLSMNYDLFFCINGCSFHPFLLSHLLKANPRLRRILYLWDDSGFYDYFHNAPFFDQITTYDLNDSEKYGVGFLPFYWCPVGMPRWGGELRYLHRRNQS